MESRAISHSLVKTLRKVPMFAGLSDDDLLDIVGVSANLHWHSDGMVFEAGEPGDALYIVLSGKVRIYTTRDGDEVEVATIGPGDFFGELSLMRKEPHSKSARAVGDADLMAIPNESFTSLLQSDERLRAAVERVMAERLSASDRALDLN